MLWPASAKAIRDGTEAQACVLPSVVMLHGYRSNQLCSASYIGGRVLITAGHCFDDRGFQFGDHVFSLRTGANLGDCESDDDCPVVSIAGTPTQMSCANNGLDSPRVGPGVCHYPDPEYNNQYLEAQFAEAYEPYGVEQPGVSVPIQYCHINPSYTEYPELEEHDFAYCILTEEPDINPVPIIMGCEIDAFLDGSYDIDVIVAGFGVAGNNSNYIGDKSGRKRWATSSLGDMSVSSNTGDIGLGALTFDPGVPDTGDSGGPLLVRLPAPHDSWRVLGVLVKPFTASGPWQFLDWMLDDPEVEATAILPCHDPDGQWAPGPDCGGFPRSPQTGSGGWLHGPTACHSQDVSGAEATCGPPYVQPMPAPPAPPALAAPAPPPAPQQERAAAGCSVEESPPPLPALLVLAGVLLALGPRRRWPRRPGPGSLLALTGALLCSACSNDDSGAGTTMWETGAEEPEPSDLILNPYYHRVHSGVVIEDESYDQLAVGNVARAANDSSCCQDLVLAGPSSPWATVLFGGGSVDHGLTFLDPSPRHLYELAGSNGNGGILDLALVDVDDDGYNDLLGLTEAGELGLRLGKANIKDASYFKSLSLFDALPGEELIAMELGDLDCDGDLDLAIAAPSAGGVVVLTQTKDGVFGQSELVATPAAPNEQTAGAPRDVAIGNFDDQGALEIVSANDDGTLSFYERDGCMGDWAGVVSARYHLNVGDCDEEDVSCLSSIQRVDIVTTDNFCDTALDDVSVGYHDRVLVFCNDGNLAAKVSPNGDDHRWDLNGPGRPSAEGIRAIKWWAPSTALYVRDALTVYRLGAPGEHFFNSPYPILDRFKTPAGISELEFHRHVAGQGDWWERMAWTGAIDGQTHIGLAR